MKKKEIKQEPVKLTVDDFDLKMDCQVTLEEFQAYALWGSEEAQKAAKKKTMIYSALFFLSGLFIMYRGMNSTWVYHDWLTILGVVLVAYSLLDLFYQFVLFKTVLKRSVAKQFRSDERLGREMTFCFAEDRMISFYKGANQGTFYYDEVDMRQENTDIIMLTLKNGKVMVFPKRIVSKADVKIQKIIAGLGA